MHSTDCKFVVAGVKAVYIAQDADTAISRLPANSHNITSAGILRQSTSCLAGFHNFDQKIKCTTRGEKNYSDPI